MTDSTDQRLEALERKLDIFRTPVVRETGGELPPVGTVADFLPANLPGDLAARSARDHLPIPAPANRELYRPDDHFGYWMMGLEDYDKVVRAARRMSVAGNRVYDFGGSTGRVFRHFYCQDRGCEVWTSDFKLNSYLWNQRHMPGDVRSFLNTATPSLPVPDQYFDIITAFSVFTHIDELESSWLLELRRVLKPGGLLYVTFHDEAFWEAMPTHLLEVLQRSPNGKDLNSESPFPGPRTTFPFTAESHYSCNVFHGTDYVHKQWGRFFEVVDTRPRDAEKQCVALLTYDTQRG